MDNFSLKWIKTYDWNQFNFPPMDHQALQKEFLFGFSKTKSALPKKTKVRLL